MTLPHTPPKTDDELAAAIKALRQAINILAYSRGEHSMDTQNDIVEHAVIAIAKYALTNQPHGNATGGGGK
jgi:hypothetical protein